MNASEQNHILAQLFVGFCYQNGRGTVMNKKLAFEYYKKIANEDCAAGACKIGYFYDNGIEIEKDLKMAVHWYEKGYGIEKNINQAIYWYEQSAKQGFKDAQNKLKQLKE